MVPRTLDYPAINLSVDVDSDTCVYAMMQVVKLRRVFEGGQVEPVVSLCCMVGQL